MPERTTGSPSMIMIKRNLSLKKEKIPFLNIR